jgi:hypothetical protein
VIFEYAYTWSDFVGNIGVILIIVAFYLNVAEKIKSTDRSYNLLNLIGSILLLTSLIYKPNLSNIIIEIIWGGISLIGLYKYYSQKKNSKLDADN